MQILSIHTNEGKVFSVSVYLLLNTSKSKQGNKLFYKQMVSILKKQTVTQTESSLPFMEPCGSLPCSQEHVLCPYVEPDDSRCVLFLLRTVETLCFHLCLGLQLFFSFATKVLHAFLSLSCFDHPNTWVRTQIM